MKITTVSIAEGKKNFSRLMEDAFERKKEIIVTKRGRPVAVIIPYDKYQYSKRIEGYRKIMEAREILLKTGILADDIFEQSRKELEKEFWND